MLVWAQRTNIFHQLPCCQFMEKKIYIYICMFGASVSTRWINFQIFDLFREVWCFCVHKMIFFQIFDLFCIISSYFHQISSYSMHIWSYLGGKSTNRGFVSTRRYFFVKVVFRRGERPPGMLQRIKRIPRIPRINRKWWQQVRPGTYLPHAPGARMTWV